MHPFVLGELACGNLPNRRELLDLFRGLPIAPVAADDEAMGYIDAHRLMGRGIGFIDVHLLASVALAETARIWTRDQRLAEVASELSLSFAPSSFAFPTSRAATICGGMFPSSSHPAPAVNGDSRQDGTSSRRLPPHWPVPFNSRRLGNRPFLNSPQEEPMRLPAFCVVLVLLGCSGERVSQSVVRDSAGIRIVEHNNPDW